MARLDEMQGLTIAELAELVRSGAKLVVYEYCVSLLVVTWKRGSGVHLVRPGESRAIEGLPYTLLSVLFGWWGFPWGIIYTPMCIARNLAGGNDVTEAVLANAVGQPSY